MFKNYFTTAWRNIKRNKTFSFINVTGLAIGLTCFVLMSVFVYDELHYDTYPADAKNIYRINLSVGGNGGVDVYPNVDFAVGQGIKQSLPGVKDFTRIRPVTNFVKFNETQFKENKLAFADANLFRFFSVPLLDGDPTDVLSAPNEMVVSKAFAQKYFGNQNPVGKSLVVGLQNDVYKVTGLFDEMPQNSHFHYDAFISLASLHITHPTWSNIGCYTYLSLQPSTDTKELQAKFPQLVAKYVVPEVQRDMGVSLAEAQKSVGTFIFSLQPLTDIHLYSHTKYEMEPNGDIQYVYIFSALALFILLLACVNFTNLSTARAVKRAREVGVRKVMGSGKVQLIRQFLSESVLMSLFAMILCIGFVFLLLPYFNQMSGHHILFSQLINVKFIAVLLLLVLLVGILAGIYPSFFLSSFNPVKVLKSSSFTTGGKNVLQSGLIVFQFFVSIALMMATIIVYQQLQYMQNKKLGYDKEQVLFLPDSRLLGNNQTAFRQSLMNDRRVVSATLSPFVPGNEMMDGTQVHPVNSNGNGAEIHMNIYHVDADYVKTLGMQMKEGRFFSPEYPTDSQGVVINETAVKELGWSHTNPVGKTIVRSGQMAFQVVGVVSDFNYASARQKIAPLMMLLGNNEGGIIIKVKTADIAGFLSDLKTKWDAFRPQGPLEYNFLDEQFAALYASELNTQHIFTVFAVLAIIIASLGLFGLSAYIIQQRRREIGIRKVLGASVQNVWLLVTKEFLWLVLIAFLIAIPVSYWAMHNWLENYAYRIQINISVFLIAGLSALAIALITISFQSIKAAFANPIKSLRTE